MCSSRPFIRPAGIVHRRVFKLISDHRAKRTSAVRDAHKMVNCRAAAPIEGSLRSCAMNAPILVYGSAGWLTTGVTLLGGASETSRLSFHAAGF